MNEQTQRFPDRNEAGILLAGRLSEYEKQKPLILALPRGGVPVAVPVARALGAPLDVLVVRKLGSPTDPEYGFGAIAPPDIVIIDEEAKRMLGLSDGDVGAVIRRERREMRRRMKRYHEGDWASSRSHETIIVVDDGLATGITAQAALQSVRLRYRPKLLIFGAPVCAASSLARVRRLADEVVCIHAPNNLGAVGAWYDDFSQVSDDAVLDALRRANRRL